MFKTLALAAAKKSKSKKGPEQIVVKVVSTVNPNNTLVCTRLRTDPKIVVQRFDQTANQLVYWVETERLRSVKFDDRTGLPFLGRGAFGSYGRAAY